MDDINPNIGLKKRAEAALVTEDGFPKVGKHHYFDLLQELHDDVQPKTYFEIGTESGASLNLAQCTSYAVDPNFNLKADVTGTKPAAYLFQGTSDDFFASDLPRKMKPKFDLAFLDGLHWFEFLLRDFMNCEKLMAKGGVITMHDCVPFNYLVAERDWDRKKTKSWTGDVWKVIPILKKFRPDLAITIYDARPSGLVTIRNLDPKNTVLDENYQQIEKEWMDVGLEDFGLEKLNEVLDLKPYVPVALKGREPGAYVPLKAKAKSKQGRRITIQTCVRRTKLRQYWGDWHFARSFADALERRGHQVRIDCMPQWGRDPDFSEFDVFLAGQESPPPKSAKPQITWLIYPGRNAEDVETIIPQCADADLLFVASDPFAKKLKSEGIKSHVLHQGFDANLMYSDAKAKRDGVLFVGSNYHKGGAVRPVVSMAGEAGLEPRIYGPRWEETAFGKNVAGGYVPNEDLGNVYRAHDILLCDHHEAMRENGFVSNRIFDALATATPVISDDVTGLPKGFSKFVSLCKNKADVKKAAARILKENQTKKKARLAFAETMIAEHSFDARAAQFEEFVEKNLVSTPNKRQLEGA